MRRSRGKLRRRRRREIFLNGFQGFLFPGERIQERGSGSIFENCFTPSRQVYFPPVPSENISKDYDDIPIRRSYVRDVLQRLEFTRGVSVEEIGHVRYGPHRYPLVLARYPRRWNAKNPT